MAAAELPLGEWLAAHKAAEYEQALRAEGCESVSDLVESGLTEDHLRELGFKLFARMKVWEAIQELRREQTPATTLGSVEAPTPPDVSDSAAAGDSDEPAEAGDAHRSGLHNKVPRFNRPDPSARTLTWSQASQSQASQGEDEPPRWPPSRALAHSRVAQPRSRSPTEPAAAEAPAPKVRRTEEPAREWNSGGGGATAAPGASSPEPAAPAAPAAPERSAPEPGSIEEKLAQLKGLYEMQLITAKVYQDRQNQLLNQLMPPPVLPPSPGLAARPKRAHEDSGSEQSGSDSEPESGSVPSPSAEESRPAPAAAPAPAARRTGDRWSRSRRKLGSQDSDTEKDPPPAAVDAARSASNSQSEDEGSVSSLGTGSRDRWSRSRRRAGTSTPTAASQDDEEPDSPPLVKRTHRDAAGSSAPRESSQSQHARTGAEKDERDEPEAKAAEDPGDAAPMQSDATSEPPSKPESEPQEEDNWWDSSGSDTEAEAEVRFLSEV